MPGSWPLCRATLLFSLCLQLQCRLPAAAPPLSQGEEAPPGEDGTLSEMQARSLPETDPAAAAAAAAPQDHRDELFPDVDPQALAAVLLQALRLPPEKPKEGRPDLKPSADPERVRSETRSASAQAGKERDWTGRAREEEAPAEPEGEALRATLRELQPYRLSAQWEGHAPERRAAAPAPPEGVRGDVLKELEEYEQLRVHAKRKAPPSEPWEGARKLRQQQHLEHQLLQRRYEELAESRRQAEEARRAAAEEERLADMASDLLLQYLLKDGEASEEEGGPGAEEAGRKASSALLFEDEEGNVAEDKRSNEAPEEEEEEEEEDLDPSTIDRLIELSSKLHLPADDVIDIINDVEKKKKEEVALPPPLLPPQGALGKGKAPAALAPRNKPKKTPPHAPSPPGPKAIIQQAYYPPARPLSKGNEDAWNEVLRGDEYPAPKWFRAQPSNVLVSNYINPRTFQPPAYHRYAHLPGPMVPRDDQEEEDGGSDSRAAQDEELENYIERVLMKRPQGF